MKVVGVDGCKGGWIAMEWNTDDQTMEPGIFPTLAAVIANHADAGAIAIDIPIGLSPIGTRLCDIEARQRLRPHRSSSVFPPPIHEILDAPTFQEAQRRSVAAIGKGTSRQCFAIFDKIREANDTITPTMQDRVFEIHPEICFWALAGRPMTHPKRRQPGYEERRALLEAATGVPLPARKEAFGWVRPAKPDDVLDAVVAAWTARRVVDGTAGRLPSAVQSGTHGLRMEMIY